MSVVGLVVVFFNVAPLLAVGVAITRPPADSRAQPHSLVQHDAPLVASNADEARASRNAQILLANVLASTDFVNVFASIDLGKQLKEEQPADCDIHCAKQRMIDAASREVSGTKAAEAAANKLTESILANVVQILAGAEREINHTSTQATIDVSNATARANELAQAEVDHQKKRQLDVRMSVEKSIEKLQTASKQQEMIQAASASVEATQKAAAAADDIKHSLADTIDKITSIENSITSSTKAAAQKISQLTTQAKLDSEALGNELQKFATSTAAKLQAKQNANAIISAASETSQGIEEKTIEFVSKMTAAAVSLSEAGKEKTQKIDEQVHSMTDKGAALVSMLSEGSTHAQKGLNEAKIAWVNAGMRAVAQVDQVVDLPPVANSSSTGPPSRKVEAAAQDVSVENSFLSNHYVTALLSGLIVFTMIATYLWPSSK